MRAGDAGKVPLRYTSACLSSRISDGSNTEAVILARGTLLPYAALGQQPTCLIMAQYSWGVKPQAFRVPSARASAPKPAQKPTSEDMSICQYMSSYRHTPRMSSWRKCPSTLISLWCYMCFVALVTCCLHLGCILYIFDNATFVAPALSAPAVALRTANRGFYVGPFFRVRTSLCRNLQC